MTPTQQRLLDKLPLGLPPVTPESRRNPYTGVTHTLEPLAVTLYDFITNAVGISKPADIIPRHVTYNGTTVTKQNWDRARYLFLALWPNEYYDLID